MLDYEATSVGHGADPGFLAVSPQMTLVINPCSGRLLLLSTRSAVTFPAKEITPWPVPNYTAWPQAYRCK